MSSNQPLMNVEIYPIRLEERLEELKVKREKLIEYYQSKCDSLVTTYVLSEGTQGEGTQDVKATQEGFEECKKALSYKGIHDVLPQRLVKITHNKTLKILAFSDYRVHDVGMLVNFVRNLKEKPDIIIYAGDDIRRFSPTPLELIKIPSLDEGFPKEEFPEEIKPVRIYSPGSGKHEISPSYGLLLRLPRNMNSEEHIRKRLLTMLKVMSQIREILKNLSLNSSESKITALKELVSRNYPFLIVQEYKERVDIIDKNTKTLILSLRKLTLEKLRKSALIPLGSYWNLLQVQLSDNINFEIKKLKEDKEFVYFYIAINQPKSNIFEELASYAKYGLAAVIGNDDSSIVRAWIRGNKVYELHSTWLKIGSFLIVGLEGSTCGMGPSGTNLEGDVKLRLELANEMLDPDDKLVVVSHAPPKGLLDRAIRFGEKAIGSIALRDFVEECDKLILVICGHVHRYGGSVAKANTATIVNVSSHDDPFSQANIAWIVIDEDGNVNVSWIKLPSLIEYILKSGDRSQLLNTLKERTYLSDAEARLFIKMYEALGEKLFEKLSELASFKFRYGFSWENVFHMYVNYGVSSPEQLTEEVYRKVLSSTSGIHKVHLMRGYAKIKRESKEEKVYLMRRIPLPPLDKVIIYDTEYVSSVGVLYGFLDLSTGELKQFWFNEKEKAREYLKEKEKSYFFIHWGGSDKKLLKEDLDCDAPTINLLYWVQTSLVAPVASDSLCAIHDVLCGHEEGEWWERSFYNMDGIHKVALCERILENPNDIDSKEKLKEANKADILALSKVVKKLEELNSKP